MTRRPGWLQAVAEAGRRLRAVWSGARMDRELDEELRFHLERATERNVRRGMDREEARRAARRSFGGVERHRERARDERGVRFVETVLFDLRLGARSLRRTPSLTGAALLILAVAVGATTLMVTVVDQVLLRPLPYPEPERLVQVWESHPERTAQEVVSRGNYLDWLERQRAFAELGAYMPPFGFGLTGGDHPVQVSGVQATPSLLRLLGAEAAVGRIFSPKEAEYGHGDAVLLSDGLWRRRFGADPAVVGETLTLDGDRLRIVGVLRPGFHFPSREVDLWLPMTFHPDYHEQRKAHALHVIGRLGDGVDLATATAEMNRIADELGEEHPEEVGGWGVNLVPLHEQEVGGVRPALLVLLAAVGLLLALACFNVANLLLARGAGRSAEVAMRSALGASRPRLVRQLLTESLLLAVLGGAAGALLAALGLASLQGWLPREIPRLADAALDLRVLAATCALSLATGVLFGVIPALRDTRPDLRGELQGGGSGTAAAGGRRGGRGGPDRLRPTLVAVQVALSTVLLAGAGLLLRSFLELRSVDYGFEPVGLLAVSLNLPRGEYPETPDHARFYGELIDRLERLPGVRAVTGTSEPPVVGYAMGRTPILEGQRGEWQGEPPAHRVVTPGYFRTLGIPVLAGRAFTRFDRAGSPPVVVINRAMARTHWPGRDPVGRHLGFEEDGPWHEIVGVVGDTRHQGLEEPVETAVYAPLEQKSWQWMTWMTLLLRTGGEPAALADAVRAEVWALDPDLPVLEVRTVEEIYSESLARRRFQTLLLALFAGFALLVGTVGLYGAMAFSVARRLREMGIRMALGARRRSVTALVLRRGLLLTAAGLAAGTLAALALTRSMDSLLYGVAPHDPATFAAAAALLAAVALAACYLPARRAARVDPARALE